ncbi:maleylacetoacetate isomerase [Pseudooceanicola sp. CBS1P-1]|uniref:Maleylacetoacetate isomerase n=1 Tax=Pseudooceanicola albus TaxID=2692189 RepID=A0A6L7G980_9RHOB|nr:MULTISPECIES: maleylacetoacetate isomerase [Pseudooceanicola]MBT9384306.1 maleylacetoacetate isomerase [Pseudooceanicola endophyticus]MXN19956.1 maleylacetoacetate isomerase [Pseudooceanicola albus]
MITLYDYWRSSASYRVRIALGLMDEAWSAVPVDLVKGEQSAPAHLARNPQGLVPVLDIDGLRLTQSLAILEYLDETRDLGLLPQAPAERARVRALAQAIAMEIHPVCNLRVARHASGHSGGEITMESWMLRFMTPGLLAFEAMLEPGSRFCHGDRPGLADLCLVPQLYNADRWGVDLSPMPRIRAVAEALNGIEAVRAAHPDHFRSALA